MLIAPLAGAFPKFMLLVAASGWATHAAPQVRHGAIVHHERVADLRMRDGAEIRRRAKQVSRAPDLTFAAFGRDFQLILERNEALLAALPGAQDEALGAIELYRGTIANVPGSWARIARVGNALSGLIFDGGEYYAIDSVGDVADRLVAPPAIAEGAVIYRLHDTVGVLHDDVQQPSEASSGPIGSQNAAVLPSFMSSVVLGQKIDVGVVGDFEFTQGVGTSKANASLIKLINVVDGIFLEGLGIHIDLVESESYSAEPDPFQSTSPVVLLGELEELKDNTPRFRPLGLLHLFTGRDLDDSSTSVQTLGVANIGVLCEPKSGVGLTQSRNGSVLDAIIAAHEIGHNFGAPHDAQPGSVCQAAPPGMLMDAALNGSTEFSQCSIEQIQIETAGATCLTPLLPANLTLWLLSSAPPAVVSPDVSYEFDIAIENTSGVDAVNVDFVVDGSSMSVGLSNREGALPDDCDVFIHGQPFRCYWSELAAGERFETTVFFTPRVPGEPATIDVNVTSLTEANSTGDSLHFDIDVLPYVDLSASIDPPALLLRPDEPGSITVSVANNGTEAANDVIGHVFLGQELDFLGASIGQCVATNLLHLPGVGYDCAVGELAPGESVDFVVDFRPKAGLSAQQIQHGARISVNVRSREPERVLDRNDNGFTADITLGDSIGDLVVDLFVFPRINVGETIVATAEVRNEGPEAIHDVVVLLDELSGSARPELVAMTATSSACRRPQARGDHICDIAQLAAGEKITMTFSIVPSSEGDVWLSIEGETASSDPDGGNDARLVMVSVLAQPPPSPAPTPAPSPSPPANAGGGGGGGGGALDPLTLSLFAALLIIAQCRPAACRRRRTVRTS